MNINICQSIVAKNKRTSYKRVPPQKNYVKPAMGITRVTIITTLEVASACQACNGHNRVSHTYVSFDSAGFLTT
jgi:hypothetical protein